MAHAKTKHKKEYKSLFETQINDFKSIGKYDLKSINKGIQLIEKTSIDMCNSSKFNEEEKMNFFNTLIEYEGFNNDINRKLVHYFIQDNSLVSFLENTNVENTEITKDEIKNSGTYRPVLSKCLYDKNDIKAIDCCVHSKNKAYYIFACNIERPENFKGFREEDFNFVIEKMKKESKINKAITKEEIKETELLIKDQYRLVVFEPDGTYKFNLLDFNKDKNNPLNNNKELNFALNFLFYKNAFPNTVTNGIPSDLKIGNIQFQNINKTIKTEQTLIEKNKTDKNGKLIPPHIRSGHFRYLGSEFYKKKRGQTIFIPAVMVNAKAETINKTDEIQNLKKIENIYEKKVIDILAKEPKTSIKALEYKVSNNLSNEQIETVINSAEKKAAEFKNINQTNNANVKKGGRQV